MYWEFVETGRADNVTSSDLLLTKPNVLKASLPNDLVDEMVKSVGVDVVDTLLKEAILTQQQKESIMNEVGNSKKDTNGRIVRDYMWIIQENHGMRDYCDV